MAQGKRIKYTCKKCGWTTSILEEWADLKPKKCVGKKNGLACNTSFRKEPEQLNIEKS